LFKPYYMFRRSPAISREYIHQNIYNIIQYDKNKLVSFDQFRQLYSYDVKKHNDINVVKIMCLIVVVSFSVK
jgi:hypothetical protein